MTTICGHIFESNAWGSPNALKHTASERSGINFTWVPTAGFNTPSGRHPLIHPPHLTAASSRERPFNWSYQMGVLLLLVGLAVLAFGLFNHFKGKRILSAPFKTTGDLALNPKSPDPKGSMSTEGKVLPPAQALLTPCSKTPCLYFEVKVERLWEKVVTTEDGSKTEKGSDTLSTVKGGALISLDDGTGAIAVDFSKGADFDSMKEGFKKELNGGSSSSHLQFGELRYDVPVLSDGDKYTVGFKATETYAPVGGSLFVLGKLEGNKIVKPGWRSMMASSKGRDGLLGSIQKKKKLSLIGGGIASLAAIPLMIFAPESAPVDPNAPSAYCEHSLTDARARCGSRVSETEGETFTWTVTKPGQYELSAIAPNKKISLDPEIVIKDAAGEVLADEYGVTGGTAKATVDVTAGTYTVLVRPGDAYMVKGGFSYELEILASAVAAPAVAEAAEPTLSAETIIIEAPMLAAEFLKNEAAAMARFDQQMVQVKGVVLDVNADPAFTTVVLDVPVISGKFGGVVANLGPRVKVKKGQVVTMLGSAEVDQAGDTLVLLANAELVSGTPVAKAPATKPAPAPKK